MIIHEFLNKDQDIVLEKSPLVILYIKSALCMDKNGKDSKHTSHISRGVHFLIIGDKQKNHKIDWCEGGLKVADTATKNIGERDLNTRIKYIMVRIDSC